jgi:hypothetical protein
MHWIKGVVIAVLSGVTAVLALLVVTVAGFVASAFMMGLKLFMIVGTAVAIGWCAVMASKPEDTGPAKTGHKDPSDP